MPRKQPHAQQPSDGVDADEALFSRLPLASVLEAMPDAVAIYGVTGELLFTNTVARKLLGLDHDPTLRVNSHSHRVRRLDVRGGSDTPLSRDLWHVGRLLRGETISGEHPAVIRFTSLDGSERTISITGAPITDEAGELLGAIAIARDITIQSALQSRTYEALQALLAMAEAVVSAPSPDVVRLEEKGDREAGSVSAPTHRVGLRLIELARSVLGCQRIGISVRDPETGVMHALAVAGLAPEEERRWWAEQRAAEELGLRLEDTPEQELAQMLLAGETISIDLRDPRYRGAPNPYGIQTMLIAPMVIASQLYGVISLDYAGEAHEFTAEELKLASAVSKLAALIIERDRMVREQAAADARTLALTQANERMNQFLGIAAHELRTPITVIKANLQLLMRRAALATSQTQPGARSALDERLTRHGDALLSRTERSLARLTRLVDDLLDVSRTRAGRLEMRIEPTNLGEVTRDAVEEQRLAAPERAITLEEPEGLPLIALADPARVDQAVTNYVTNALKYSRGTAPVHVRIWSEDASGFVSVTDSGVGIPEEEQPHVWELFYRIPGIEVVSGSGIGLGLGLHLCKTIIERQGGQVGLTSQVGLGSTFWFSLPLLLA